MIEQRFAREKVNVTIARDAAERRIEEALVVHGDDDGAGLDHPFAMKGAVMEENLADDFRQRVAEPVPKVHDAFEREIVSPIALTRNKQTFFI